MYYISTRTWTRRANLSGVEEGRNKLLPFSYIEQNIISLGKIFRLEGHRILRSSRNIFTLVLQGLTLMLMMTKMMMIMMVMMMITITLCVVK